MLPLAIYCHTLITSTRSTSCYFKFKDLVAKQQSTNVYTVTNTRYSLSIHTSLPSVSCALQATYIKLDIAWEQEVTVYGLGAASTFWLPFWYCADQVIETCVPSLAEWLETAEKCIARVSVETLNLSLIHPHMVTVLCPHKEAPRPVFCTFTHSSTHNWWLTEANGCKMASSSYDFICVKNWFTHDRQPGVGTVPGQTFLKQWQWDGIW